MSKVNPYEILKEEKDKLLNEFFMAIAALESYEEVRNFFKDLLSESESVMLARRLQVARMLIEGRNYEDIRSELKIGFDTINVVNKWLGYGRNGYIKAIEKLDSLEFKKERRKISDEDKANPFSWYNIKKRYPLHFWPEKLVSQLDEVITDYLRRQKKRRNLQRKLQNIKFVKD